MNLNSDKIFNKKDKIILVGLLLFIFSFTFYLYKLGYLKDSNINYFLDLEFKGRVLEQFTDKKDHGAQKFKLSDNNVISAYYPNQNSQLKINDSVVKKRNSVYIMVFRNKKYLFDICLYKD